MATTDFKADISAMIKKYTERNKVGTPRAFLVTPEAAMIWHGAATIKEKNTSEFLDLQVKPYMRTIPCNGQKLVDCKIVRLAADSGEETRFE